MIRVFFSWFSDTFPSFLKKEERRRKRKKERKREKEREKERKSSVISLPSNPKSSSFTSIIISLFFSPPLPLLLVFPPKRCLQEKWIQNLSTLIDEVCGRGTKSKKKSSKNHFHARTQIRKYCFEWKKEEIYKNKMGDTTDVTWGDSEYVLELQSMF